VTQPIRNISTLVIDFGLAGEAASDMALPTSSRGALMVSCSRTAVLICCILSNLAEVSDNTLVNSPLPSLTPVVLFPSLRYNLQVASYICLYFLSELPKTGNRKKDLERFHEFPTNMFAAHFIVLSLTSHPTPS
jgi:hypothetical protein